MALFNYTAKEITLKVVYYGPAFSGKTTNLQCLHTILPSHVKGKLISMATEGDRTIFFDFLPVDVGKISEFNIRFQLYTVPGQVRYNATRRLVLKGADAVVFVADSQIEMRDQNIESLENMKENLGANNISLDIPKVFQFNKRDISNVMSIQELNEDLNKEGAPFFEAVAVEGRGVEATFRRVTKDVLEYIKDKHKVDIDVPESSILSDAKTVSGSSARKADEHIAVGGTKPGAFETQKAATIPVAEPKTVLKDKAGVSIKKSAVAKKTSTSFKEPVGTKETGLSSQPATPDISALISAIDSLKDAVSEINRGLKGIQINQMKGIDTLTELRQILSEIKEKKRFKRFFK